jgi:hypothetical protein
MSIIRTRGRKRYKPPKWKRGLCQTDGCNSRCQDRKPFCPRHYAERIRQQSACVQAPVPVSIEKATDNPAGGR